MDQMVMNSKFTCFWGPVSHQEDSSLTGCSITQNNISWAPIPHNHFISLLHLRLPCILWVPKLHHHHKPVQRTPLFKGRLLHIFQGVRLPICRWLEWRLQRLCHHHVQLHQPQREVPPWPVFELLSWKQRRARVPCFRPFSRCQFKCRSEVAKPLFSPNNTCTRVLDVVPDFLRLMVFECGVVSSKPCSSLHLNQSVLRCLLSRGLWVLWLCIIFPRKCSWNQYLFNWHCKEIYLFVYLFVHFLF